MSCFANTRDSFVLLARLKISFYQLNPTAPRTAQCGVLLYKYQLTYCGKIDNI